MAYKRPSRTRGLVNRARSDAAARKYIQELRRTQNQFRQSQARLAFELRRLRGRLR